MAQAPASAAAGILTEDDVRSKVVPVHVGAGILGYSYARLYQEAYGLVTTVLSPNELKMVSKSKFVSYRTIPGLDEDHKLIRVLSEVGSELQACGKVGLLTGSDDWYVTTLSRHKEELEQWFVVPYADYGLIDEITQKSRFYSLCEELGIPYPKTWTFSCGDPLETLDPEQFTYPLIAKPSNSTRYQHVQFPGKKKIFEVQSPQELGDIWKAIRASDYDRELIIQDFVPGGDDGLRSLTLFADEHGDTKVSAMGRVVLQDHNPMALGNPVCILGERDERVVEDAARFLKRVGYHGWANFDVKYDPRDGSYRFFEVNTRPGRNTYYVALGGVNFAKTIVEGFVLGHELPVRKANRPFLYATVPAYVIRRSVSDEPLREQVLGMYRSGQASNPMFCEGDSLEQKFWARLTYVNQIRKFKRYLWDTNGRQADGRR